jgi:hypothetical protein
MSGGRSVADPSVHRDHTRMVAHLSKLSDEQTCRAGLPGAPPQVTLLGTFLAIGVITTVTDVSQLVEYLIALIGLGVAIDYSLLIVTRWHEERQRGRSNLSQSATARMMRTATVSRPRIEATGKRGIQRPEVLRLFTVIVSIKYVAVAAAARITYRKFSPGRAASRRQVACPDRCEGNDEPLVHYDLHTARPAWIVGLGQPP